MSVRRYRLFTGIQQVGRFMSNARHVVAALLVMLVVPPGAEIASGQRGRAPRVQRNAPLTVIPDQSLSEALETADAVVVARVNKRMGTRIVDIRPELMRADAGLVLPEPLPVPFTEYDVTPIQVVKDYPLFAFGTAIRIASRGGVSEFNGKTIEEPTATPQLVEGRRYLVFLRFSKTISGMLFHTFDVFDLSGPTVAANEYLRDSRHGKELVGLPPEQALSRVRILLDKLQQ